ncbi:MAG: (Fe-S)-binding protein [Dehalococcoidia bacterium]|nr:(Fe-S)-binding protein [Dehalococcoidia bacterium]
MEANLFVTCVVDQLFPQVGEAAVKVLRRAGVDLDFPSGQTCCGQLAYNAGYHNEARRLARRFLRLFADGRPIVAPSGSCATMVRVFYRHLLQFDPDAVRAQAAETAARTYELSEYLVKVLGKSDLGLRLRTPLKATYHESCHALRELGLSEEPRTLLRNLQGLELVELENAQRCCGFGGTFAVKFPDISEALLRDKLASIQKSGADVVTALDASCLMHLGGALSRQGSPIRALHLAEVLGMGLPDRVADHG